MPKTVAETGDQSVPTMPDLTRVPWDGWRTFWNTTVTDAPVDPDRTDALARVNLPIRTQAGNPPYEGSTYGTPYQLVTDAYPKTAVWDNGRPVTWEWFMRPVWPTVALPLPAVVRRMGDPGNASDRNWIGYDEATGTLYETILMTHGGWNWGQADWTMGYKDAVGLSKWNTNVAWDAKGQPKGVTAASWPLLPMLCRWQEIQAGVISHAVNGALPDYAPLSVPPARGTDGKDPSHPLRCGDRLRLKPAVVDRFTGPARVVATALATYGWFMSDRNWQYNKDGTPAFGTFPLSMDKRWTYGEGTVPPLGIFEVQLTDFEVLASSSG